MPEEASQSGGASGGSASSTIAPSSSGESQQPSAKFGETSLETKGQLSDSRRNGEASSASGNGKEEARAEKPKSRYQRTIEWRKGVEERERKVAERERLIAEHEQRQRQPAEPGYTLEELKRYRAAWAREAEFDSDKADLVRQADVEIRRMEGKATHAQQWLNAEAQLRQSDPDFGIEGTPIDRKIREILGGPHGAEYRKYPLGIVAVYDLAKRMLMEEENKDLRTKFSRTEEEIKRLNGLTSIGGGAPGQMGGGGGEHISTEAFSKLSLPQMRERLRRDAARASR